MADENKITIELSVEGNAKVELKNATKAVQEFGAASEESSKKASGAFEVFKGVLAADAVTAGLGLVKDAASALFQTFIVDGIKAAAEQEEAVNRLNASLQATGKYTPEVSQELQDFAGELQRTTKFSDDLVLEVAGLIQTLGNLDKNSLKSATQAALDMSAALGIDATSAANLLGKAANGNVSALQRYGIEVQKGSTDAETFANALTALNSKFGGRAQAEINTFAGGLASINNNFGELQETTGNAIVKNETVLVVFKQVNKALIDLNEAFSNGSGEMNSFVSNGVIVAIQALEALALGADVVGRALSVTINSLATVANGVAVVVTGIAGIFDESMQAVAGNFIRATGDAAKAVKENFTEDTALSVLRERLSEVESAAQSSFGAIRDGASNASGPVKNATDSVAELSKEQKKLQEEAEKTAESAVKATETKAEQLQAQLDQLELAHEQELISDEVFFEAKTAVEFQWAENKRAIADQIVQDKIAENEALRQLDADANATRIAENQATIDAVLAGEDQFSKTKINYMLKVKQQEEQTNRERMQAATTALNALASMQNAKTKEIAFVGKAAAIALATINTFTAATGAFAALSSIPFVGPALGFAAAAAITAAGLANVAKISGVDLATGIDEVPGGFPNDTFRANLTSGERVVPVETNKGLKRMIDDSVGQRDLLEGIYDRLGKLQNQFVVNIGNREIINEFQRAIDSGRQVRL